MGCVLHPELWSAGVFLEDPDGVERLHGEYLAAGAEILITASYQMSFSGLARAGLSAEQAATAMRGTVEVARRARERRGAEAMIAASIGPYGAVLCDGSEYRGYCDVSVQRLIEFHRPRFEVLAGAGADLLAIETIPSLDEAQALLRLLEEADGLRAWISFSCRDAARLADGTPIVRAAEMFRGVDSVVALGVNCTAPDHVAGLIDEIRSVTDTPIVAYPNSGEVWDARTRRWSGDARCGSFVRMAGEWAEEGAWAIGGCCRVGPELIRRLALALGPRR